MTEKRSPAPGHNRLALFEDPDATPQGSRTNKVRGNLHAVGLVRVEVWVPRKDVPRVKKLEAECAKPVLDAARARGELPAAQEPLTEDEKQQIIALVQSGQYTAAEVARQFGVNKSTVSRLLAKVRA